MIALRLTSGFRIAVVGSPGYFSHHQQPKSPFDLFAHACINYRWASTGQLYRWPFLGADGPLEVDVDGTLVLNDTGLIRDAAIRGVGLACLPETAGQPQIENGSLVRVLETWCDPFPGFYLYHPIRRQTPPPLRALISFLETGRTQESV